MVSETVGRSVSRYLQNVFAKNPDITFDYVASASGVSKNTVHRVYHGHAMFERTARKIASFIEQETKGVILADELLKASQRDFRGANLENADLSGEDLSGMDFSGMDLREADFSGSKLGGVKFYGANLTDALFDGVTGGYIQFQGAITDGVVIRNTDIHRWDLQGTRGTAEGSSGWDGAVIENAKMLGMVQGVDFRTAQLSNVVWNTGNGQSYGLRLNLREPEKQIKKGFDNPEVVSFLIETRANGDLELLHIAWKIRARAISNCWIGFVQDLEMHYPGALEKLLDIFEDYPDWHLNARVDLAFAMMQCTHLSDWLDLRKREDYLLFKWVIENEIRKVMAQEEAERAIVLAD